MFWLEKNAKVWRRTPKWKFLETQSQSCLWKCKTIFGAQITFTRSSVHLSTSGELWKNMPFKFSLPPTGLASTLHRFRYKLKLLIFNPLTFSFVVSWILFTFFWLNGLHHWQKQIDVTFCLSVCVTFWCFIRKPYCKMKNCYVTHKELKYVMNVVKTLNYLFTIYGSLDVTDNKLYLRLIGYFLDISSNFFFSIIKRKSQQVWRLISNL